MKNEDVEKLIGRKLKPGKSLQEETTPEEFAKISFISCIETWIISESTKRGGMSAKEVEAKAQEILDRNGGDYQKALSEI